MMKVSQVNDCYKCINFHVLLIFPHTGASQSGCDRNFPLGRGTEAEVTSFQTLIPLPAPRAIPARQATHP